MSLAPQRPNFVLVWIGVILLTFSLLSNFLAESSAGADSTAGGRAGVTHNLILEDFRPLPRFFSPASALEENASTEPQENQLAPYSRPFREGLDAPFASQPESIGMEEGVDFPVELLEPAAGEELRLAESIGGGVQQPRSDSSNHALRQESSTRANELGPVAGASSGAGSLKATYGGSGSDRNRGLHSLRAALETSGPGVSVKAKVLKTSNRNTVLVSFFVSHPNAEENLKSRLDGREISPKVKAMAREYMKAVQDTEPEDSEDDIESEEDSQEEFDRSSLRRELIRKLRQRPGGLEIIAEMTPAQLRELANKLDARSAKLRALMN